MIPVKLTLRNFMCFRDNLPSISFEGIHTACISGNNGNGKSALIDAITWALWGQSRANSDDELIHSGQTEVEVEFEFNVGPQLYRIIRRRSRPRTQKSSGQTILEFQLSTPEGYKVLTGDTTTQTQQKIIQVLHMDYETFINSAFLRQGHADEFTKKRPGERKQVLSNILQLSVYDELEAQTKELSRGQETAILQLENALDGLQEEIARKPAYQTEYDQAQNELTQAEQVTGEQENRLALLRKEKEALENKKTQLAEITAHLQDTGRNFDLWSEQATQYQSRIESYENLIIQRSLIEENYQLFLNTRRQCQDFDLKLKQVNSLMQGKHRLEMAVIKAGEELNRAHAVTDNRMHELEVVIQKLPSLHEELKGVTARLRALEESEKQLQEKRESSKILLSRVHFLQAEKTRLSRETEEIEEKLKMLSHQEGVKCPLCDTELGHEGQKRIETKYMQEKSGKGEALKADQAELERIESEEKSLETSILQFESRLKHQKETAQNQHGNLNKAISDAREAGEKIILEKNRLDEIEQRLASRDFALNEQQSLARIEKEIAILDYDARQHELWRSQAADYEQYEAPHRKLEEALQQIGRERESEAKAQAAAQELKLKLEIDRQRQQTLLSELISFNKVTADLSQAEKKYQELMGNQKRLQEVTGGARVKLERLVGLEGQYQEKEAQLSSALKQDKIYKDLAQVFGKKGIQAMLIEMAIPEIESEANKLLSRMTDNRMHVKIETQKETRKGEVMETLDINISDELGTRNYEMFSGGETFRIDFAIRIALSRLLARRAGAPLPTLIIDEGFGTQDSTGIEKIKEAITSIQDDFEKILVITHIADFKDAFPMRFEVVKTPEGSAVYLN
jgi:DNA repair protein SbcC/Rad50